MSIKNILFNLKSDDETARGKQRPEESISANNCGFAGEPANFLERFIAL
jgi:hypothetical protein